MTDILTWNVQWGKGVDGRVDLKRIADVVRSMSDPDVICLQEISRFIPELDGGTDQVHELAELFPGHSCWFGPAVDMIGEEPATGPRRSFGNLILSRLPVTCAFRHPLPQPAAAGVKHMTRQATEVNVETPGGPLRVVTTHLEYHTLTHRAAQVARLRELHFEAAANEKYPPKDAHGPYTPLVRPGNTVLCGDFNFEPDSEEYAALLKPFEGGVASLADAWRCIHGEQPHDPTCGIHDRAQWPGGPHCRDFFFATSEVCARAGAVQVNMTTDASDHQPLLLSLKD
ncbi:MAG: endonuclease/exonuclease/phosphatase family protein [Hyphomicrobiaceae bacterium]|nr:endonuclease/exonuclease/phosphatase family protein [Hyphomicrobiaceae bacterium]